MSNKKSPNPVDKHVGARVRMRRMMISMSQEKLGDQVGITFQQIQKYEKGTNRIGASRLQQIATVLGVPVAFFFEGVPSPLAPAGMAGQSAQYFAQEFLGTREGLRIVAAFDKITDHEVKRRLADLAEAVANVQHEVRYPRRPVVGSVGSHTNRR